MTSGRFPPPGGACWRPDGILEAMRVAGAASGDPSGPIASGRDADVYAIDEWRVLRRYRDGGEVVAEAALMRYAAGLGYPVPTVYGASGVDLVMERLHGPTMAQALGSGALSATAAGELLADLHLRLHRLPPRSGDPGNRILHLDLHPANVIMEDRGPMVIDWRNATEGPPEVDVALTALILAEVAGGLHVPELAPAARGALQAFLAAVTEPAPVLDGALDRAVGFRSADPNVSDVERQHLSSAATLVRAIM